MEGCEAGAAILGGDIHVRRFPLQDMYRTENVSCRANVTEAVHAGKDVPFDEAEQS